MVDVYENPLVLNRSQLNSRQLLNHRFMLIWQNIGKSTNQLQLDTCRKMIEGWFLNEGHITKAKELFDQIQHREIDLLLIQTETLETK